MQSYSTSDVEARVLKDRFGLLDGRIKTLGQIGEELGIEERGRPLSRARIWQIEGTAIRKLRSTNPLLQTFREYIE